MKNLLIYYRPHWCFYILQLESRHVPVSGSPKSDKFSIMPRARAFWYSLYNRWKTQLTKFSRWVGCCQFFFIDAKTMTVKEDQTSPVHSILYFQCTRLVWFSLTVIIFASIKTKDYTHVFGPLCTICTTAYIKSVKKNHTTDRHLSQNCWFWTT